MKKIRNNKGFSLMELLAVIVIMALAAMLASEGLPRIGKALSRQLDESNAGILLSTTMTLMRTELSTASEVKTEEGKITYVSGETGAQCAIENTEEGIKITEHLEMEDAKGRLLVSQAASTNEMYASFGSLSVEDGVLTIKNLAVYKNGSKLAETEEYKIRIAGA